MARLIERSILIIRIIRGRRSACAMEFFGRGFRGSSRMHPNPDQFQSLSVCIRGIVVSGIDLEPTEFYHVCHGSTRENLPLERLPLFHLGV